jgi:hypothetical protein
MWKFPWHIFPWVSCRSKEHILYYLGVTRWVYFIQAFTEWLLCVRLSIQRFFFFFWRCISCLIGFTAW